MKSPVPVLALVVVLWPAAAGAEPASSPQPAAEETPRGWYLYEEPTGSYEIGSDREQSHSGRASGRMKALHTDTKGFGALGQRFMAQRFLGKRVRFSAFIRTDRVLGEAGLSMRIDWRGDGGRTNIVYSTIDTHPVRGRTNWTPADLVVDVPTDATQIALALLLRGPGTAWIDDVKFEVVDKKVPLTSQVPQVLEPRNLGFED
jgi:hypothetical protein